MRRRAAAASASGAIPNSPEARDPGGALGKSSDCLQARHNTRPPCNDPAEHRVRRSALPSLRELGSPRSSALWFVPTTAAKYKRAEGSCALQTPEECEQGLFVFRIRQARTGDRVWRVGLLPVLSIR